MLPYPLPDPVPEGVVLLIQALRRPGGGVQKNKTSHGGYSEMHAPGLLDMDFIHS